MDVLDSTQPEISMRKRILIGLMVLGTTVVDLYAGVEAAKAPGKVVLQQCKKKKSGVAFDHAQHSKKRKIDCKTCHHTGKQAKCVSCHAGKAKDKKPGCEEMSPKKNPYHITCMGCHKKQNKGPKTCKACHK